jgi:hypothetical protein
MSVRPRAAPAAGPGSTALRYGALAALVLASRMPLWGTGLGTDNDGWALAGAAARLARTGVYRPSRLPGFPLQEFAGAAIVRLGGTDGLVVTATLMAVAAALLLARLLRLLGARVDALPAATLAFVPVIYVASASAMDYTWGLALVIGAMLALVERRPALAGLLLGLAIGTRITSAVLVAPLALMARPGRDGAPAWRGAAVLAIVAGAVGTLCFVPVLLSAGPRFLTYYEHAGGHQRGVGHFLLGLFRIWPLPFSPALVAGQALAGVWGVLGAVALAAGLLVALARAARPAERRAAAALPAGARDRLAWAVAVALVLWLYLRLPDDEGYLAPAVPFVLLLLASWLPARAFRAVCLALLLAPFVLGVDAAPPKKGVTPDVRSAWARTFTLGGRERLVLDPLRGPVTMDRDKRLATQVEVARVRAAWAALPEGSVLMAGLLYPQVWAAGLPPRRGPVDIEDILPEERVRALRAEGRAVWYLRDVPQRTRRFFDYPLDSLGARPLPGR